MSTAEFTALQQSPPHPRCASSSDKNGDVHVTSLPDMDPTDSVPLPGYLTLTVVGHEFATTPHPPNYARGRLLEK